MEDIYVRSNDSTIMLVGLVPINDKDVLNNEMVYFNHILLN
jgi:hypothetical protein